MATDQIEPALSAEGWKRRVIGSLADPIDWIDGRSVADEHDVCVVYEGGAMVTLESLPETIALANHALPDDSPYKITRADVASLREVVAHTWECDSIAALSDYCAGCDCDMEPRIVALTAKLAALLPPEVQP